MADTLNATIFSLAMTDDPSKPDYQVHANVAARRDYMRSQAMLTLESLNDAAMGTGIVYTLTEMASRTGYYIAELGAESPMRYYIVGF